MKEIWKDISGFENYYQVSNLGRVKSLSRQIYNGKGYYTSSEKILKGHVITNGYIQVEFKKDNKRYLKLVHRLVAETFIPNLKNLPQINHIDGNKQKNNIENLEWCTNSENQIHAYHMGLNKHSKKAGKPKRKVVKINIENNKIIKIYDSISEASRENNISKGNIIQTCKGFRKHAGDFKWSYIENLGSDVI